LLFENVAVFTIRGLNQLLCELTKNGYDAQWICLQASDFGYAHKRARIFIVAYPIEKRPRCALFKPVKTVQLHSTQKQNEETYLRITAKGIHTKGNYFDLCGVNGFPRNYRQLIAGLGNAVNVTMAEYVFRCIIDYEKQLT
jgi:DNA (cytosine-5)-methyltransferase 1